MKKRDYCCGKMELKKAIAFNWVAPLQGWRRTIRCPASIKWTQFPLLTCCQWLNSPNSPDECLHRWDYLLHGHVTIGFVLQTVLPNPLHWAKTKERCHYAQWMNEFTVCTCVLPTISRWTWFEAEGGAEACAVVKAPALLDLPGAGGFRDVLLAGRVADTGARGQRRSLVPNGLGWSGIVHPDPIPEANFTADSENKTVRHLKAQYWFRIMIGTGFFSMITMSMPLIIMGNYPGRLEKQQKGTLSLLERVC